MKKNILWYLILVMCSPYMSFSQQFKWVKGGGTGQYISKFTTPGTWSVEGTYQMCTDGNGNIYALNEVGYDALVADTFYLAAGKGTNANLLLTSYTCSGQMRFAKFIAASGETGSYSLLADNLGHIYVAGMFYNGGGSLMIGSLAITGHQYQYNGLIQFDTAGNYNWINFIGDNTTATSLNSYWMGNIVVLDKTNNAHYINYTRAGVHLTSSVTSLNGTYDLKYSTTGTLLSAKKIPIDSSWIVQGAAIDNKGKLYVYGEKNINYGADQFFTAAFDTNRNLIWMYELDTLNGIALSGFTAITADNKGHLYFAGAAQPPIGSKPTTFTFRGISATNSVPPYINDISIILKTDTNANPIWLKHYDGSSSNSFMSITVNGDKVAAAGYFYDHVISKTDTITAGIGVDPFFVVVDTAGNHLALKSIHGDGYYDQANVIVGDSKGNFYIGGQVEDSIKAPGIAAYTSVGGNSDFFIMKYGYDCNCVAPIANYTYTGTKNVSFSYTGTTALLDSVVWTFGDGGRAKGTTATHNYTGAGTYTACATAYNNCGSNKYCNTITISTSVSNIAAFPGISIYPNPIANVLLVEHATEGSVVKIFNIIGQQVYYGTINSNKEQVNTANLLPGSYILQLTDTEGNRMGITIVKQ